MELVQKSFSVTTSQHSSLNRTVVRAASVNQLLRLEKGHNSFKVATIIVFHPLEHVCVHKYVCTVTLLITFLGLTVRHN